MSGKAYTMKEMKTIVEYLTEHKAFGEIKGRKMWKDLADSKVTNRTWQSLKETFIKRILPDIHNPYYNLSLHEIASFKQGHDVEARLNNKLQIRSTSRDSTTESEGITNEGPDNGKEKNETNTAGELKQSETDIRASTETLVLDDCYENSEDKDQSPKKSLRELITYSEPLTPMLQAVLDDFATDDGEGSNDEPKMQIVEMPDTDLNGDEVKDTTEVSTENVEPKNASDEKTTQEPGKTINESTSSQKPESDAQTISKKETLNEKDKNEEISIVLSDDDNTTKSNRNSTEVNLTDVNKPKTSIETTQNSNTTTDTLLPDNQEGFKGNSQILSSKINNKTKDNNKDIKRAKKRATSQENPTSTISKKRLEKDKLSISDTDTLIKNKKKVSTRSTPLTLKQNIAEEVEEPVVVGNSIDDQVMADAPPQKEQNDEKAESVKNNENNSEDLENPCLKSVSLYAEQFSNSKYTDSETSNIEDNTKNEKQNKKEEVSKTKKDETINITNNFGVKYTKASTDVKKIPLEIKKPNTNATKEVVILKSHSDSISDSGKEQQKKVVESSVKQTRDKALANMFGFSSGVTRSRKSSHKYRKQTSSRKPKHNISSDSSDWTSDTGSEYISPPRGRKNRHTRKYLKPKSARILSLEEEGGLFVMYGKKIYPVVKDGKIIKNYVNLAPDNDNEREESFWKLKYVEEKKRTAELTKLLNQVKEQNVQEEISRIPALATTSRYKKLSINKDVAEPIAVQTQGEKTVKIKFTKNNEEVQLEGHWTHVNPVLAQVMQLFQKEPEIIIKETTKVKELSATGPQQLSGKSTPIHEMIVDEEVQEKVDQIEGEIFKEIEEREKEKSPTPKQEVPKTENNITKRKGRPKKSQNSANEQSPAKKPRVEDTEAKPDEVGTPRSTRTPKKVATDSPNVAEDNTIKTRQTAKKSLLDTTKGSEPQDDDVRYKFPSPPPANRKSYSNRSQKVTKNTRQRKSSREPDGISFPLFAFEQLHFYYQQLLHTFTYACHCYKLLYFSYSSVNFKIYSSPENLSLNSIESTQGYQDSDDSPIKTYLKRKKRTSFTLPPYRTRSQTRSQNINPPLTDDFTSDSSNSYQGPPIQSMVFQNSTLKSDVYKSDSYQLLMNNVTLRNKSSSQLEKINEASPISDDLQYISDQICKQLSDFEMDMEGQEKENFRHTNTDSSSNVTLPTSPVLSIVENISISKSLLNNSHESLLDDKQPESDPNEHIMLNELMETDGDVSMPLMERDCGVETTAQNGAEYHYNLNVPKTIAAVSESFLNKINTVNLTDPTLSDSFHYKLRDLILESAKKNLKGEDNVLSNCQDVEMKENVETKVSKSKKRSSTPRKRQSTRRLKLANTEPCIEEEHMETCSYTSRKSCPPVIQVSEDLEIELEGNNSVQISEQPRGRRKKDVIKVKISKPKQKKTSKEAVEKNIQNKQNSIHTDSGINDVESGVFLNTFNDSVDLIHNHSDTCLNANECLGDSIEIIKNATKSIISLDSDTNDFDGDLPQFFGNVPDKMAYELFSSDAQDVSVLQKVIGVPEYKTAESASATVYHTPLGSLSPPDSLITEDLSGEIPEKVTGNTKWYLLSEDEISNTNNLDINQNIMAPIGFGANLNQIFPITCAIPDLSTITEMSKENDENTRKSSNDTDTRNDLDSQSLFN
ncbi:uncharacterized protein LOC124537576 [Vanessa cardui]|uniref:uncharacterized protein LOC124537576 n=1 Tax=Vanessa cardui TaxID=171605 RepID=UPI001F13038D|nr:uncharacterized protein LOC124537576 [Vanessa cardui]